MKVTDIRLNLVKTDGAVKAVGSFSLDSVFAVRGIRVMEDKNGRRFVAFPCREKSNGEYEDIAFPVNSDFYHEVTNEILSEYNRITNVNANSMGKF